MTIVVSGIRARLDVDKLDVGNHKRARLPVRGIRIKPNTFRNREAAWRGCDAANYHSRSRIGRRSRAAYRHGGISTIDCRETNAAYGH